MSVGHWIVLGPVEGAWCRGARPGWFVGLGKSSESGSLFFASSPAVVGLCIRPAGP